MSAVSHLVLRTPRIVLARVVGDAEDVVELDLVYGVDEMLQEERGAGRQHLSNELLHLGRVFVLQQVLVVRVLIVLERLVERADFLNGQQSEGGQEARYRTRRSRV